MSDRIYARLEIIENRSPLVRDAQRWRWRLVQRNGKIVAEGGQGYCRPGAAELAAAKVLGGNYDIGDRVARIHDTREH